MLSTTDVQEIYKVSSYIAGAAKQGGRRVITRPQMIMSTSQKFYVCVNMCVQWMMKRRQPNFFNFQKWSGFTSSPKKRKESESSVNESEAVYAPSWLWRSISAYQVGRFRMQTWWTRSSVQLEESACTFDLQWWSRNSTIVFCFTSTSILQIA